VDELRKRKNRKVYLLSDLSDDEGGPLDRFFEMSEQNHTLTPLEAEQCLSLLRDAMTVLSAKDRMAFVLRELENLSYTETAAVLETSEVAARIRVSRARKQLQHELGRRLNAN
jgi:RNA polymerase sigma factor (sigma-70 family)